MRFIGVYDYTVILTYMSLVSGLIGIKLAYSGEIMWAILCVGISGFLDMFDGVVARTKKNRTEDQKNFGIQLDSLCDVVCFGVVPAVILYFRGVDEIWGIAFLIFYVLCALIRLAFFNVLETKRQRSEGGCAKSYRGLPVTTIAIILPACFLVGLIVPAMPYLLSFAAGAMLYVVVEELIPEMSAGEHSNIGVIAFAFGFSLMMALDVALG